MPPLAELSNRYQFSIDDFDDPLAAFNGYVEVTAVEDPSTGAMKDEIMIVLPLPERAEKALDEDPLYYYPPSTPGGICHVYDMYDFSEGGLDIDDKLPPVITNRHNSSVGNNTQTSSKTLERKSSIDPELEYNFMEELMQTLDNIFGCSYGGCTQSMSHPILKSALRRKDHSEPPLNHNVSFTSLVIREFPMTLGIHPSAVTGPPVMLDWDSRPTRESVVDLDSYEKARRPRRNRRQLKLSFEARRRVLENDRGFTVEEVKKAWSEALKIRKQRQETRLRGPHEQLVDEIWESACRKYNRWFKLQ